MHTPTTLSGDSPFVIAQVNDCIKLNNERLKGNYAEFRVEVKQRRTSAAEIDCEHNSFTYEQFVRANNNESLTSRSCRVGTRGRLIKHIINSKRAHFVCHVCKDLPATPWKLGAGVERLHSSNIKSKIDC